MNQAVSNLESKAGMSAEKGSLTYEADGKSGTVTVDVYAEDGLFAYAAEGTP